jgi:hypothetical protein
MRGKDGTCMAVVGLGPAGIREAVMTGPANAVLLCDPCAGLAGARHRRMEALGFCAKNGTDPRLKPMVKSWGALPGATVWRSEDGTYLYEPPAKPEPTDTR